jgi:hypothetical protein
VKRLGSDFEPDMNESLENEGSRRGAPVVVLRRLRWALVQPLLLILIALVGAVMSGLVQRWGIEHLGWFEVNCDPPGGGLASCAAPTPRLIWMLLGSVVGVALWYGSWWLRRP